MPTPRSAQCHCPHCQSEPDHPDKRYHRELRAFLATLSQEQRRLYAAVESNRLGRGGVSRVAEITGVSGPTVARGRRQLAGLLRGEPQAGERKPIPGRPRTEAKFPAIMAALEEMLSDETAGSPVSDKRWQRSSVRKLSRRLKELGHQACPSTVARLLSDMGYSLRANKKRRSGSQCPGRDEQFRYIASQRESFGDLGLPIISVDTKKKELIGNFRKNGRVWCREPTEVNEHDFTSTAEYRAVPFGIYDTLRNQGFVVVGLSNDTPEFAVNAIGRWWREAGCPAYPAAGEMLILADCGGTNGNRCRAWKLNLQEKLCDGLGLGVTVCHYPPGCSKWNPIEHRLWSQISMNWAGRPLRTLGIMLGYIRGTTTRTGLTVEAVLDEEMYAKGQKVSWKDVDALNLTPHDVCPEWNYTIRPSR
jgi:hypothetical protein